MKGNMRRVVYMQLLSVLSVERAHTSGANPREEAHTQRRKHSLLSKFTVAETVLPTVLIHDPQIRADPGILS